MGTTDRISNINTHNEHTAVAAEAKAPVKKEEQSIWGRMEHSYNSSSLAKTAEEWTQPYIEKGQLDGKVSAKEAMVNTLRGTGYFATEILKDAKSLGITTVIVGAAVASGLAVPLGIVGGVIAAGSLIYNIADIRKNMKEIDNSKAKNDMKEVETKVVENYFKGGQAVSNTAFAAMSGYSLAKDVIPAYKATGKLSSILTHNKLPHSNKPEHKEVKAAEVAEDVYTGGKIGAAVLRAGEFLKSTVKPKEVVKTEDMANVAKKSDKNEQEINAKDIAEDVYTGGKIGAAVLRAAELFKKVTPEELAEIPKSVAETAHRGETANTAQMQVGDEKHKKH